LFVKKKVIFSDIDSIHEYEKDSTNNYKIQFDKLTETTNYINIHQIELNNDIIEELIYLNSLLIEKKNEELKIFINKHHIYHTNNVIEIGKYIKSKIYIKEDHQKINADYDILLKIELKINNIKEKIEIIKNQNDILDTCLTILK
jgi:hypothetical protein